MKPDNKPDRSPATQHDQPDRGPISKPQLTDHIMPEKDLARGSEPQTRAASRGR